MMNRPETDSQETDPNRTESAVSSTTRRSVLRAAGLVALAGGGTAAIAGCSSATETATPGAPSSAAPSSAPSASAPSSAAPSSAAPSSAAPSSAAPSAPAGTSVALADVPEGSGVVLKEKYVVTQPKAGEYKAFTAICTHAGCPVEKIQSKEIICPCHGSHFSIADGSALSGPAQEGLAAVDFTVSGDNLTIPD